jgi:hypothetical protein
MSGAAVTGSRVKGVSKMSILIEKKMIFVCSKNFKLLGQIKGNLINNCGFLTFIIYMRAGHCYSSAEASKNPSHTTGTWPAFIEYCNTVYLI